ncbi:MAG: phosphoglucosamine mutase, partial [Myxococcota bacterium]|nr:phosphoglucosamine mutase [Myxococcota bacterium]
MKRFGTDGIRGRWGSPELNADLARGLGSVLADQFSGPIPIVCDTRESGPAVLKALEEGLGSRGVNHGVLPTPALSAILAATS